MGLASILGSTIRQDKLYNITFKIDDERTVLEPCIPDSKMDGEDSSTTRVCFSDSVERCISAIAPQNRNLSTGSLIVVRSVNTSTLNKKHLYDYHYLYLYGKVRDAMLTHEFWYTDKVPIDRKVYRIKSFDYEHVINWSVVDLGALIQMSKKYVNLPLYKIAVDAEDVYRIVSKYLQDNGKYDASDEYWEEICMLPMVQAIKVTNLKLEEVG